jgi:hypothetical protein
MHKIAIEIDGPLIFVFDKSDRQTEGAYFWDSLREIPAWKELKYEWIARSRFGDQVIFTTNSPIHSGPAVYMHGPDVAGPDSADSNWIDNILYLGPLVEEWLARVERFGDEYSVAPGTIDESVSYPEEYRKIYRELNPGLRW